MAIGAYKALKAAGVLMPSEMGLVGYANVLAGELMAVPLSSVDQNAEMIGAESARLLLQQVTQEASGATMRHVIPSDLVIRESSKLQTC